MLAEWPPGFAAPPHYHPYAEETFHVLAGRGLFRFGDSREEVDAPAGSFLFAPRGLTHAIRVPGPESLLLLVCVTPNKSRPDETVDARSSRRAGRTRWPLKTRNSRAETERWGSRWARACGGSGSPARYAHRAMMSERTESAGDRAGSGTGISVLGVDHLNLRVADLERSLRFYRDLLGLREAQRDQPPGRAGVAGRHAGGERRPLPPAGAGLPPP